MRGRRWTRPTARLAQLLGLPLAVMLVLALVATAPPTVRAATITVTDTGTAVADDGKCTLIEAIEAANANTASGAAAGECPAGAAGVADTIALAAGATYTLTAANNSGADGPNGLPVIRAATAIVVEGHGATIERGAAAGTPEFRLLLVGLGASLALRDLTVRNGRAAGNPVGGGIFNDRGTVTLTGSTVSGNTAAVDGGGIANLFGTVTLTDSAVSGNTADGAGGGIVNLLGTVTLTSSVVSGNGAVAGGGIANLLGTVTLTSSAVSGNTADTAGGGILNSSGTVTLTGSAISGNTAVDSEGGGIFNFDGTVTLTASVVSGNGASVGGGVLNGSGAITLTSSTVSGNTADTGGGILNDASGTVTLTSSTVSGNAAGAAGGGILNGSGAVTLTGAIVAGNRAGGSSGAATADCAGGSITSTGHNLTGSGTGCPSAGAGDITVAPATVFPAVLGPLAANGGPTPTHLPPPGSPAIDAGPAAGCPPTDQRGLPRPADGDGDGAAVCDIGAVEVAPILGLTRCYLAEGYTGPGFDEYLTIFNPNTRAAELRLTYFLNGAPPVVKTLTAAAGARATVAVHDPAQGVGRDREVSVRVESTNGVGVVVERPIYFTYAPADGGAAIDGGHVGRCLGLPTPPTTWRFAEGYTGPGFDEYLTILNPNPQAAQVEITYLFNNGTSQKQALTVAGERRTTVAVHDVVGRGKEVSAEVVSTNGVGVVVERPIYFRYQLSGGAGEATGGHVVAGALAASATWHFAEGYAAPGFDEYLTIMNPQSTAAQLRIDYALANGTVRSATLTVPARERTTVTVHAIAGAPAGASAARAATPVARSGTDPGAGLARLGAAAVTVTSTNGVAVIVERPMYFRYAGPAAGAEPIDGGHNGLGAPTPAGTWLFAEGFTGAGFDEYLLIYRPGGAAGPVEVTYYNTGGGVVKTQTVQVAANGRVTIAVHDAVGRGQAVAAKVTSLGGGPIVAERSMYFRYTGGIDGGSVALGMAAP